ncbi:uncharacterized protein LOC8260868 [Ricinus communis]|uniref:Calmodulin binding protein n=1 Tax=Ricinus communis TaxID=3988 RepID=B9R7H6_RICCO|nr:uncharacterized protein LOC8260868 [Ricinus communis]EEF52456.1 conserved hypothetical protein [Ricinus communis]|eukprot:XP_002510269.1 uncharacterized protein LOC8260868 [Ricinus communis]
MLKLEVAIPAPGMDFDFNDARPMPFLSAPSTPKRFGDYSLSVPSSPSRMAEFYRSFDDFDENTTFTWEQRPATPKSPAAGGGDDFAFDFRSELEENSLSAEELFDGGKIKPLKPPPKHEDRTPLLSPRSPIAQGKKMIREVFSPRKKKDHSDPFATERGRERGPALTSNTSRRAARSLSPYRVSEYPWEEEERKSQESTKQQSAAPPTSKTNSQLSNSSSSTNKSSSRKWRLRDFLLFRSASEGRASDKEYKYPSLFRRPEDAKNSSFRSSDSSSGSASGTRRKAQLSAHELHYKTNKAASEDMKKKTYLPYRQGILGRLAFSPATPHVFGNGVGSLGR